MLWDEHSLIDRVAKEHTFQVAQHLQVLECDGFELVSVGLDARIQMVEIVSLDPKEIEPGLQVGVDYPERTK